MIENDVLQRKTIRGNLPMSVFAPSVVNLWKVIEHYGIDAAPLFADEDVSIQLPIDPSLRIPYEKVDRIRARAVEMSGDEAFGLRAAEAYLPSQFGALGYAWHASLTLRRACQRLERFIRIANVNIVVRVEDRDDCMVVTLKMDFPTQSGFARDDGALALLARLCRMICGERFRLHSVRFKHAEPLDIKPYFEFFACPLKFDQDENQLLIPLSFADKPLPGANPELVLINEQVITRRLASLDQGDIIARVRATLMDQLPQGGVSDDSVARDLHMSVRTLHRKLSDAGSNFRALLAETRRSLADFYILDNSLTLTEISLLLGFSEQSSFSRAYKKWTGSAPSEVRSERLSGQ